MTLDVDQQKLAIANAAQELSVNAFAKLLKSILFVRADNKLPSTGKPVKWSVTNSRGTAYGWLKISAPPGLQERWTDEEQKEHMTLLASLLGIPYHSQGTSVAPQSDCRRHYLARCLSGTPLGFSWQPNWD